LRMSRPQTTGRERIGNNLATVLYSGTESSDLDGRAPGDLPRLTVWTARLRSANRCGLATGKRHCALAGSHVIKLGHFLPGGQLLKVEKGVSETYTGMVEVGERRHNAYVKFLPERELVNELF